MSRNIPLKIGDIRCRVWHNGNRRKMRMNTIIIYGSCYGTTEVYAKALADWTGLNAVPYDRTGDLSGYQRIIYLGGLYAGGVKGLVKTVKKIDPTVCGRFVVITVGLADPEDELNYE